MPPRLVGFLTQQQVLDARVVAEGSNMGSFLRLTVNQGRLGYVYGVAGSVPCGAELLHKPVQELLTLEEGPHKNALVLAVDAYVVDVAEDA